MVVCFGIYSNLVAITNVRDKPFHTFTILPPFIIIKRIELQSGLYLAAQGYGLQLLGVKCCEGSPLEQHGSPRRVLFQFLESTAVLFLVPVVAGWGN